MPGRRRLNVPHLEVPFPNNHITLYISNENSEKENFLLNRDQKKLKYCKKKNNKNTEILF